MIGSPRTSALLTGLVVIALGGCSGQPAPTASTLTGTIAQASFPSAVKKITVISDAGKSTTAAVGSKGKFSISLEKGAAYRFLLSQDGKGTPLIVNSAQQGRLVTSLVVKSGGATVDIGSVRFWAGDAATQANVVGAGSGQCVKGFVDGSSKPCAGSTAAASCDDEEGDDDGEQADDGADCVDGIDAVTHQSCDGGPAANQNDGEQVDSGIDADATKAMGVPELNVPNEIGCDEEDDDGESEGD